MEFLKKYLTENNMKKFLAIILLLVILYLLKPFKNMLLLTFIISFLFNELINYVYKKLNPQINISKKIITVIVFILFTFLIASLSIVYIPKLTTELLNMKSDLLNIVNENDVYLLNDYIIKFTNIDYYINYLKENSDLAIKTIFELKDGTITILS